MRIRKTRFGKDPRTLHVPLRPVRGLLGLLERVLLPLMPLTAGQMATFANDGTAASSEFLDARMAGMTGLAAMLEQPGGNA